MSSCKSLPFESCHDGKCDTCNEHKLLDGMVRKYGEKGTYECIDCLVEKVEVNYTKTDTPDYQVDKDKTKVQKLMRWCFGE